MYAVKDKNILFRTGKISATDLSKPQQKEGLVCLPPAGKKEVYPRFELGLLEEFDE
jgi:hypothetical protein